jgi:hypothetical protein
VVHRDRHASRGGIGAGAPTASLAAPAVSGSAIDAFPWDGYRWSLDGVPILGTGRTYTLTVSVGRRVSTRRVVTIG